jgi:colanic acid/amylovoran biosynthesis glycosyltransferase
MRIAFCTFDHATAISGVNTWMVRFLPQLAAAGANVRVFVWVSGAKESWRTVPALRSAGIECECYGCDDDTCKNVREILRLTRSFRPDVFVPNCMFDAYYAVPWIRKAGIPTVGVIHSDDPFYTRGVMDGFVTGRAGARVSALVCVSEAMRSLFSARAQAGVCVECIPCGVEMPDSAVVAQLAAPPAPFRIIYAGRMVEEQKRVSEVARSLCRVVREVQGVEGVMYGDGADRQGVVDVMAEEGAGLPVRYGGAYEGIQVYDHMRRAQAMLLLSDYEGMPVTVMEAMACGLVPICLRIRSGLPELIEHGRNGYLVDDRGPAVVAAVRDLVGDPSRWVRMSAAARMTVAAKFSLDSCVSRWLELLGRLAPARRAAGRVRVPWIVRLPEPHPDFVVCGDVRPQSVVSRVLSAARRVVDRLKRFMPSRVRWLLRKIRPKSWVRRAE